MTAGGFAGTVADDFQHRNTLHEMMQLRPRHQIAFLNGRNHLSSRFVESRFVRSAIVTLAFAAFAPASSESEAAEPGWSPVVIPTGAYRERIKAMPIEQRPYRPFHFYGNTIRRMHYQSRSPQSRIFVSREVRRRYR